MLQQKNGGCDPANEEVSISSSGSTGAFCKSDMNTVLPVLLPSPDRVAELPPQYSIDAPHTQYYATIPNGVQWLTPEREHTQAAPWCCLMECLCHFDNARMERYFIAPITQGILSIGAAIDRYHCEPGYMKRKIDAAMEREGVLV